MISNGFLVYVVAPIAVGWMAWVSLSVINHGRAITKLLENESKRVKRDEEQAKKISRMDRNIVRIGVSLGIDNELERET